MNTFMGKGAISKDDEHCLYTMGLGMGDYNNLAFDTADLVISCGYDLVEYAPKAWNRANKDGKKIKYYSVFEVLFWIIYTKIKTLF